MKEKESRIFVSAMNSVSKRLERYGDAYTSDVSLLKLIYKYAGYSVEYSTLKCLDEMVAKLQIESPHICLESAAVRGYVDSEAFAPKVMMLGVGSNQAPVLGDLGQSLADGVYSHTFTTVGLYSTYSDDSNGIPSIFVIHELPSVGVLYYDGSEARIGSQYTNPGLLSYSRDGFSDYIDGFKMSVYDNDSQLPLESNIANVFLTVAAITGINGTAVVGDRAQYADNRATTIFYVADFTTQTIAPYFDPENNELDAIRIDEVSTANKGVYYFLGDPVVEGQVITNAELAAGSFYHVASDGNSISTDSFNASVRDTGSMIWVQ